MGIKYLFFITIYSIIPTQFIDSEQNECYISSTKMCAFIV